MLKNSNVSTTPLHGAAHLELTPHQQMRTSSQHSSWWLVYLQLVCNLPVWRATQLHYMLCQVWVVFFLTCHTKVKWFYGCDNFNYSVSVSMYDESELTMLEELHGLIWSHILVVVMAFGHMIFHPSMAAMAVHWSFEATQKNGSLAGLFLSAAMMW